MRISFRQIVAGVLVLAGMAVLSGCDELSKPDNYTFKNESSVTVTVAPNGQSWSPAQIGPGQSIEIVADEDYNQMQYFYLPSSVTIDDTSEYNTTIFRDK